MNLNLHTNTLKIRNSFLEYLNLNNRNINELTNTITHSSYYANKEQIGNSRYVFLGMFAFKGDVANLLQSYIPGKGQHLQHILGNLFALNKLENLFDKWNLEKFIRFGNDFNISSHKHIFVYAVFGYVKVFANENELKDFIVKHILDDKVILSGTKKKYNLEKQLHTILLQKKLKKPTILINNKEDCYCVEVYSNDTLLATQNSKSIKYAKAKALKKAIINIISEDESQNNDNETFVKFQLEKNVLKTEKQKTLKFEKHQEFLLQQKIKKEERNKRLEDKKIEKELRDMNRKNNKAKRKQVLIEKEKKEKQKQNIVMNAGKRRFLEDKQK